MKIWEIRTCQKESKLITSLKGHTDKITSVSFSGDRSYLTASSANGTVIIWVNINGSWFCDKIFSAFESPLSALHAKVEHVIASKRNKKLLKQLVVDKDEVKENEVVEEEEKENKSKYDKKGDESEDEGESDETEGEMEYNLILAREAAHEFSELFRKKEISRYEELIKQKFMQLSLIQVLASSVPIQKGFLKPELFEKAKDEVTLNPGIISSNKVAPGDINSKSAHHNQKSNCCVTF